MTCEKTERVFPLNIDIDIDIYLIDIEPTGYNISLQMWERLFPKGRKNIFLFSYARRQKSGAYSETGKTCVKY